MSEVAILSLFGAKGKFSDHCSSPSSTEQHKPLWLRTRQTRADQGLATARLDWLATVTVGGQESANWREISSVEPASSSAASDTDLTLADVCSDAAVAVFAWARTWPAMPCKVPAVWLNVTVSVPNPSRIFSTAMRNLPMILSVYARPWTLCADPDLENPGRALVIMGLVIFVSIRRGHIRACCFWIYA